MRFRCLCALTGAVVSSLLFTSSAVAGGILKMNHVWSRMADIYGEPGSVESAEFSPDSNFIVTGSKFDFTVRMFRTSDGFEVWRAHVPDEVERVAFTRDGKYVVSGSEDYMMRVLDAATGEVVFDYEHQNGIDAIAASHDGRFMVTGQEFGENGIGPVRVFDPSSWELVTTLDQIGTANELDFTRDDSYMVVVGSQTTRVFNVSDWSLHFEDSLKGKLLLDDIQPGFINAKFSPDGKILAVGGTHGFVYLYDVESGDLLRRFNKTGQKTETVTWTKDGRYLLVAGHSTYIDFYRTEQLLDPETGNDSIPYAYRRELTDNLEYMDFDASGTLFTTAHQDGTVQLWTFMSDDPNINSRRHDEIREVQRRAAEERARQ